MTTRVPRQAESRTTLILGDGEKMKSEGQYKLSMLIHGAATKIEVEVMDTDLPLLIGRGEMMQLVITLLLYEDKIKCTVKRSAIIITDDGLPAIKLKSKRRREASQDERKDLVTTQGGQRENAQSPAKRRITTKSTVEAEKSSNNNIGRRRNTWNPMVQKKLANKFKEGRKWLRKLKEWTQITLRYGRPQHEEPRPKEGITWMMQNTEKEPRSKERTKTDEEPKKRDATQGISARWGKREGRWRK